MRIAQIENNSITYKSAVQTIVTRYKSVWLLLVLVDGRYVTEQLIVSPLLPPQIVKVTS